MKHTPIDWRAKAKAFLEARKFPKGFCHVKQYNENQRGYKAFGIVYVENNCKIHLMGQRADGLLELRDSAPVFGGFKEYKNIDAMLDDGWDVD